MGGIDLWTTLLLALYGIVVFLGQGAPVVLAYGMPSLGPRDDAAAKPSPEVSVIIAARNEEEDLPACLDDLLHQDLRARGGRMEVLVVDGGSTDRTAEVARAHPLGPRVIPEPPLPPGWVGKNWACHTGSREARGDALLFLDADVRLAPEAVRVALARLESTGADLLTLAARVVMEGFWERVVLPLYTQFVLTYFRSPHVNDDGSERAMANGQFMLFSRAGYEKVGGHAAVRGDILEDVRLAQEVKRRGGRIRLYWAPDLLTTRMYRNRKELREGLLKNLHGTRFSLGRQVGFAAAILAFFLSPFVLAGLGVWEGNWIWVAVAGFLIAVTLAKQAGFQRALRAPLRYALTYPLGCLFYLDLLARSIHRGTTDRQVTWKGRTYAMDGDGSLPPP